jgi:hypothetical protein
VKHGAIPLRWRLRVTAKLVARPTPRLAVACAFLAVFAGVIRQSFRAMAILGVAAPPLTRYALEAFCVLVLVRPC